MTDDVTTAHCVVCHRLHDRGGYACQRCHDRISDDLRAIVDLTALALDWTPTTSTDGGHSGKPGSRPPTDLGRLDAILGTDALAVLEEWERIIREDFGLAPYGVATERTGACLTRTVDFLLHWLERITESWPPVDELAREVRDVRRSLNRYDDTIERGTMRVPCPAPTDDGDCGMPLHVSPADLGAPVVCRRCGEQWNADRLLLVALSDPDLVLWMDPEVAAYVTGHSLRTLQRWAAAGTIDHQRGRYELRSIRQRQEASA